VNVRGWAHRFLPDPAPDHRLQPQGGSFSPLSCCDAESECEAVNPFYSKCVDQPQCVAENAICGGSGDHIMKDTACCNSTTDSCVPWGDDWKVCRKAGEETCAAHGEQCGGSGASSMKEKACCAAGDKCVVVNQYYSKCGEMGRESNHHALAATIQHAAQRERIPAGRSQLDERIPRISAPRSCALQTRQRRRGS